MKVAAVPASAHLTVEQRAGYTRDEGSALGAAALRAFWSLAAGRAYALRSARRGNASLASADQSEQVAAVSAHRFSCRARASSAWIWQPRLKKESGSV